ncbi:MAG: hypothetical protein RRY34_02615 [Victivallaceae bacterium]
MEKIRKTTDLADYTLCHEIDCRMGERQLKILSIYLKCLLGVGLLFLICWLAGYWLPDLRMACEFLIRFELGIFFVGLHCIAPVVRSVGGGCGEYICKIQRRGKATICI